MSNLSLWLPVLVPAVAGALVFGGWRARTFVLIAILAAGISDGLIGGPLKKWVKRSRPHETEVNVRQLETKKPVWKALWEAPREKYSLGGKGNPQGRSFPSNHTLNTITIAMIATLVFKRFGWLSFIPALLVAWSRVYTGAHWPSDAVASICMGLGVGMLVLFTAEWIWRTFAANFFPNAVRAHPFLLLPPRPPSVTND